MRSGCVCTLKGFGHMPPRTFAQNGAGGQVAETEPVRLRAVDTWDAITSRRDVRSYTDQPIAPADLDRILEAAWRAPSSNNEQRWDFLVVTERRRLQELAQVWQFGGHVATSAATIALVAPDASDAYTLESIRFDLGQAAMSIMLAAADL